MSQNERVLKMLKDGRKVTRLTVLPERVMNLTARIADLRAAGHKIKCNMETDSFGNAYGSFVLVKD